MTPSEAAWTRAHALPHRVCAGVGAFLLTHCPCQFGQSAHCATDRCHACAHRTQAAWYSREEPETYLLGRDGGVIADVFHTGRACRWRCACPCHRPDAAEQRGLLFDL
ncbi:DUF6248 family natural product biosynthesis protein [Streptomyces sp. NPDC058783]|uniref:DUF6248 family natural product biosynthesis protein n=1 Tax=Streptomyces sp. NPDC058783 TaxID=3346633 RepID=UPI0036A03E42